MLKCLLIEDDIQICNLIRNILKDEYKLTIQNNAKNGLEEVYSNKPDIIILDLGLPDLDGNEIVKSIRMWSKTPIIILSARTDDIDKVSALDLGADDYLTKPFSVLELKARLRVLARRIEINTLESPIFETGLLRIDYSRNTVYMDNSEIHLTPSEYKILVFLSQNAGKVITHKKLIGQLCSSFYTQDYYDIAKLRVFMATLRKKIEPNSKNPIYILTHL